MSLFTFHNEFDDVDVTLNDTTEVREGPNGLKNGPPFTVSVVFNAPEIGTKDTVEQFDTLRAAYERFVELVKGEIQAVLDDGSLS